MYGIPYSGLSRELHLELHHNKKLRGVLLGALFVARVGRLVVERIQCLQRFHRFTRLFLQFYLQRGEFVRSHYSSISFSFIIISILAFSVSQSFLQPSRKFIVTQNAVSFSEISGHLFGSLMQKQKVVVLIPFGYQNYDNSKLVL